MIIQIKQKVIGQNYFFNNGTQLYLIFQLLYYTLGSSNTGQIAA